MAPRTQSTKKAVRAESFWAAAFRHVRAQFRFLIAIAVGIATALLVPTVLSVEGVMERTLAGWNAGGWLFLLLVIVKMWHADVEGIKSEADIERESRGLVLAMVILGSLFTLLALVAQLSAIKSEQGIDRTISISLSVSTILLSWLLIHTMFAAYYAHEFHGERSRAARGRGGGLEFPGDHTPDYVDFLYFAFVVGTTAQTSDVEVTLRSMRFVVMLHGILSFFFNTAVIALTVNLAAQLVQG